MVFEKKSLFFHVVQISLYSIVERAENFLNDNRNFS